MHQQTIRQNWSLHGQSTLEYLLVLSAVLAALIYGAVHWIRPSADRALQESANVINASADQVISRVR